MILEQRNSNRCCFIRFIKQTLRMIAVPYAAPAISNEFFSSENHDCAGGVGGGAGTTCEEAVCGICFEKYYDFVEK